MSGLTRAASEPVAAPPAGVGWRLVFADEFAGSSLDGTRWTTGYWWDGPDGSSNYGNRELEWYRRDEVLVGNGTLRLRARPRVVNGFTHTSGMVSSEDRFGFQYGYAEARIKVPRGRGLWPAFWLAAEDRRWPPEVDIFEILGHQPDVVHLTHHWRVGGDGHEGRGDPYAGPDFSTGFHRFGLLWEPGRLTWYIDGVARRQVTDHIPGETMYLIANLAVGGTWPGSPDATTRFPAYLEVDWVRVWQRPVGRRITGRVRTEILSGGIGDDTLAAGGGGDTLIGGGGNDVYVVRGGETVVERPGGGRDVVRTPVTFTLTAHVEGLTLTGTDAVDGTGNAGSNVITGNAADNVLTGGLGNDTLSGGGGEDTAAYRRARREFRLTRLADGAWRIFGPSGTDRLVGIERVRFSDTEIGLGAALAAAG